MGGLCLQVIELGRPQHLHAERVDEIHVADQADGRLQRRAHR